MRKSINVLAALVIASAGALTAQPAEAMHQGRHHHRHHSATDKYLATDHWQNSGWGYSQQYSPCGAPCRPGQIDPSRPGGLDANFTPRGK